MKIKSQKKSKPLVSISCLTYNHVNYIKETLDSFLMQKTNFEFEVLIHDDASTDGTEEIIREYTKKHPSIFKPLYEEVNQWSLGRRGSSVFNFPRAKGKYVALCEGDDYWTDPLKLQKQVDLMEKHDHASMCVAINKRFYPDDNKFEKDKLYESNNSPFVYFEDLKHYYFHTSTYLIRKSALDYILQNFFDLLYGDTSVRLLLISRGPFVVLNDYVSVYRLSGEGAWTSESDYKKLLFHYNLYHKFRKYFIAEQRPFHLKSELKAIQKILAYHKKQKNIKQSLIWKFKYLYFLILHDSEKIKKKITTKLK